MPELNDEQKLIIETSLQEYAKYKHPAKYTHSLVVFPLQLLGIPISLPGYKHCGQLIGDIYKEIGVISKGFPSEYCIPQYFAQPEKNKHVDERKTHFLQPVVPTDNGYKWGDEILLKPRILPDESLRRPDWDENDDCDSDNNYNNCDDNCDNNNHNSDNSI